MARMNRAENAARKADIAAVVQRVRNREYNGYPGGCGAADVIGMGKRLGMNITDQEAWDALYRR